MVNRLQKTELRRLNGPLRDCVESIDENLSQNIHL